jgi:hypothetical protein
VAITAGAQAQAGSMGTTAGASAGPSTGKQAHAGYYKGMAVFVHARGGLMVEAAIGGQTITFEPYQIGNPFDSTGTCPAAAKQRLA